MTKSITYSQNFLKNKSLVTQLIENSSISNNDTVYEIGVGEGIITEELLKISKQVIAFEIDPTLFTKLEKKFQNITNLELIKGNFLDYNLPATPYKVFSNIPFNITSQIIRKLTETTTPPEQAYLIVQKESAEKFAGKPYALINTQINILLKPWFNFEIIHEFKKDDFFPKPQVDSILLKIKKLRIPLIKNENKNLYEDFVVYAFNQPKPNVVQGLSKIFTNKQTNISTIAGNLKPSQLDFEIWLKLFNHFLTESSNKKLVKGSFQNIKNQQNKLKKINRTRVDKNWRKF